MPPASEQVPSEISATNRICGACGGGDGGAESAFFTKHTDCEEADTRARLSLCNSQMPLCWNSTPTHVSCAVQATWQASRLEALLEEKVPRAPDAVRQKPSPNFVYSEPGTSVGAEVLGLGPGAGVVAEVLGAGLLAKLPMNKSLFGESRASLTLFVCAPPKMRVATSSGLWSGDSESTSAATPET